MLRYCEDVEVDEEELDLDVVDVVELVERLVERYEVFFGG